MIYLFRFRLGGFAPSRIQSCLPHKKGQFVDHIAGHTISSSSCGIEDCESSSQDANEHQQGALHISSFGNDVIHPSWYLDVLVNVDHLGSCIQEELRAIGFVGVDGTRKRRATFVVANIRLSRSASSDEHLLGRQCSKLQIKHRITHLKAPKPPIESRQVQRQVSF